MAKRDLLSRGDSDPGRFITQFTLYKDPRTIRWKERNYVEIARVVIHKSVHCRLAMSVKRSVLNCRRIRWKERNCLEIACVVIHKTVNCKQRKEERVEL